MLVGIEYGDLGRRTRVLLWISVALVSAGAVLWAWRPGPPEQLLRVGLLAVLALGAYWLSFLAEFRGRLTPAQVLVASLLGLLPWLMVLVLVSWAPEWVALLLPRRG
jgi:hypothetical protein